MRLRKLCPEPWGDTGCEDDGCARWGSSLDMAAAPLLHCQTPTSRSESPEFAPFRSLAIHHRKFVCDCLITHIPSTEICPNRPSHLPTFIHIFPYPLQHTSLSTLIGQSHSNSVDSHEAHYRPSGPAPPPARWSVPTDCRPGQLLRKHLSIPPRHWCPYWNSLLYCLFRHLYHVRPQSYGLCPLWSLRICLL
jgi:hypothetical protein